MSWSTIDEGRYPRPGYVGVDEGTKIRIESHFIKHIKKKGMPNPIKGVGKVKL